MERLQPALLNVALLNVALLNVALRNVALLNVALLEGEFVVCCLLHRVVSSRTWR